MALALDKKKSTSKKRCTRCGKEKLFAEFTKDKNRKDGHYPVCKECRKPLQTVYRKASASKPKKHVTHKTCGCCKENKPVSGFIKMQTSLDGFYHYCKKCHQSKSQIYRYKKAYGFTEEQAKKFAKNNIGDCEICGANGKLVVDHCHATGAVRGFLCNACNKAIGFMKDDPLICLSAAKYLEEDRRNDPRTL